MIADLAILLDSAARAWAVAAVCFFAAMLLMSRLRTRDEPRREDARTSLRGDPGAGLRHTSGHGALRPAFAPITAIDVGARPVPAMLLALSSVVFRVDASGYAGLGAAVGAGAMTGGCCWRLMPAAWVLSPCWWPAVSRSCCRSPGSASPGATGWA